MAYCGEAMTDHPRIQIRRLIEADASLFREIRLEALKLSPEAFGSSFEQESTRSLDQFEQTLRAADVFGAFRDADLVGMAGYRAQAGAKQAHKGYLWGMYVRPAARGTGVGRQLVEAVLGHARERVELVQLTAVSENQTAQRLYRSLGMLLRGGVAIVPALDMVAGLLSAGLQPRLLDATRSVRDGQPLSHALEHSGLTTAVSLRMLRVGERAGNMGEMMERAAAFHDEEMARWAEWITRLLGPLLMLVMGLVIGTVVVLMFMPIFQLAESVR